MDLVLLLVCGLSLGLFKKEKNKQKRNKERNDINQSKDHKSSMRF
jgi:hypothetical protein